MQGGHFQGSTVIFSVCYTKGRVREAGGRSLGEVTQCHLRTVRCQAVGTCPRVCSVIPLSLIGVVNLSSLLLGGIF